MDERDMVMDALSSIKASIGSYAKIISETSNQELRQTFQEMRDGDEKFQYDLYKRAAKKGYYIPSPMATAEDTDTIKSELKEDLAIH